MKTFSDFRIEIPAGRSGEVDVTCPQCSPSRKKKQAKCLSVNTDKGVWTCMHCGWAGGLNEPERRLDAGWRGPQYRRPALSRAKPIDGVSAWLASRGISKAVMERNRISATTVYMPQIEDHVGVAAFPYYRGEELVNVKYRDREKNFRMEAGAERVLYGLNDIETELCVIVEGEVDKLSVETSGIVSCVSVPDGAPVPTAKDYASKFSFLESDAERIQAVKRWVIAVDSDEPGQRLEDELARRLGREKCTRVRWPGDCKDANDVLRSFGPEVVRECIENAEPFPIEGLFTLEDASAKVSRLFVHGWEKALSTGWDELDQFYRVRPGELTVVTGAPGSGKSNMMDALAVNIARDCGWRFMLFSPENQPVEDHVARMIEKLTGQPFFDGPTPRMDEPTMQAGMKWVMEHFSWYLPGEESEWTVRNVISVAKQLVYRQGIRGVIIDPWNELECARSRDQTETEYIGSSLKSIRQFARQHGVHVWIVAHPQKLERKKDGAYPIPTMYDIAGSAHWRNKADNGLCVWRNFEEENSPVELYVQKIRFRQNGKLGCAKFQYRSVTATYHELPYFERGARS